ncbi:MAG: carboxypeptidase regulatory-like domain-containing protein [Rhodobacteraceae bacterium]|nr:carboxypeptidase regulatory-like domain-containing protein [Paracoccaceae bacterium]
MSKFLSVLASAFLLAAGFAAPTAAADLLPGMGAVSGTVTAPTDPDTAKVYAWNADMQVGFSVWVADGKYRAINMFPGTYEVTVSKNGLSSESANVTVTAGNTATADFTLAAAPMQSTYVLGRTLDVEKVESFDDIYPPGPGRDVLQKTCFVCHGVNFLPGLPQPREAWAPLIDYMITGNAFGIPGEPSLVDPARIPPQTREILLDYLEANMGPDKPTRAVKDEGGIALDKDALGKAMIVEYWFPNTAAMPNRWTQETHFDADGNVYVTERGLGAPGIVRLDPRTGEYRDYPAPDPKSSPHGLTVDVDGTVWWGGRNGYLGHLDPKTGATDQYFGNAQGHAGHTPVFDSKGDLWFSMLLGNKIGHWSRATNTVKTYDSPEPRARPYGLIVDYNDKVWYVEYHTDAVVKFDPETETFRRYPIATHPAAMRRLGIDSKGFIWYGVYGAPAPVGKLGRLDPDTGEVIERELPIPYSNPYDAWADDEDNIWASADNYLVKFDQKTEQFTTYPLPERTDQPKISITRDGAIWYTPRFAGLSGGMGGAAAVLYPDKDKITTYGAYYSTQNSANFIAQYKGPGTPVRNVIISNVPGVAEQPGPPPKAPPADRTPLTNTHGPTGAGAVLAD